MDHVPAPDIEAPKSAPVSADVTRQPRSSGSSVHTELIQAKLSVGPAGDRSEEEADSVAAVVMRNIRRQPTSGEHAWSGAEGNGRVQPMLRGERSQVTANGEHRRGEAGGVDSKIQANAELSVVPSSDRLDDLPQVSRIQPKAVIPTIGTEVGALDADADSQDRRATATGERLDDGLRQSMERGFGADFSRVRVHDDATADDLSERIQAKAVTTGSDIFLRQGGYNPSSPAGQKLVAHELTHVVQHGATGHVRRSDKIQRQDDEGERNKKALERESQKRASASENPITPEQEKHAAATAVYIEARKKENRIAEEAKRDADDFNAAQATAERDPRFKAMQAKAKGHLQSVKDGFWDIFKGGAMMQAWEASDRSRAYLGYSAGVFAGPGLAQDAYMENDTVGFDYAIGQGGGYAAEEEKQVGNMAVDLMGKVVPGGGGLIGKAAKKGASKVAGKVVEKAVGPGNTIKLNRVLITYLMGTPATPPTGPQQEEFERARKKMAAGYGARLFEFAGIEDITSAPLPEFPASTRWAITKDG